MRTPAPLSGPLANVQVKPHPRNHEFSTCLELLIPVAHPAVTIVALNRPRKRNAVNANLWNEIGRVFCMLGTTGDGCRSIVLTGNGSAFSAGIDVTEPAFLPVHTENVAHTGLTFLPKIRDMQACFTALEECPVPVIAAIHGSCIGAGVDLICSADIRICHSNTTFGVREVALGLCADVGTLQRLPAVAGNQSLVRQVCLTGDDFDAATALQMGLISRVVSQNVVEDAVTLGARIAQHSPVAVIGTKRALLYARDHSVADSLEQVAAYNALALQSDDLVAAWTARATKKKPTFADLPAYSRL